MTSFFPAIARGAIITEFTLERNLDEDTGNSKNGNLAKFPKGPSERAADQGFREERLHYPLYLYQKGLFYIFMYFGLTIKKECACI